VGHLRDLLALFAGHPTPGTTSQTFTTSVLVPVFGAALGLAKRLLEGLLARLAVETAKRLQQLVSLVLGKRFEALEELLDLGALLRIELLPAVAPTLAGTFLVGTVLAAFVTLSLLATVTSTTSVTILSGYHTVRDERKSESENQR